MIARTDRDWSRMLLESLVELEEVYGRLLDVIEEKIACMRGGEVDGMNACVGKERDAVRLIGEIEGRRRMATSRLVRGFGVSPTRARRMKSAELAEKMPARLRGEWMEVTARLKSLTTRVTRRNQVAGSLGKRMLEHMDVVLSAMTTVPGGGSYSPAGGTVAGGSQRLFETVG